MKTTELVQQATNPAEALLAVAAALDRIEAALAKTPPASGGWSQGWTDKAPTEVQYTGEVINGYKQGIMPDREPDPSLKLATDVDGSVTIDIEAPTDEVMEARRQFATDNLKLGVAWKDLPGEAAVEAYAVGGPLWLYHADRDLMAAYQPGDKAIMISEIEEAYPREARDIARDINKRDDTDMPSLGG